MTFPAGTVTISDHDYAPSPGFDRQGTQMNTKKRKTGLLSGIFFFLGVGFALLGMILALTKTKAEPVLVEQPQAAMERVQTMLDALCEGDYDTVTGCLYGTPVLGLDREPQDAVGRLFWQALTDSYTYELQGDFYATDSGVAVNATITALDLNSVTVNLRQRAQDLLEERIDQAEDTSEIYDNNNEYREDFVMGALYDAALAALEEDAGTVSWELTLNLVYKDGHWWIMPEQTLLHAISGGVLK